MRSPQSLRVDPERAPERGEFVVVSLGSNCGDREGNVAKAIEWLCSLLGDALHSSIYETPPVGNMGSDYMNAVVSGFSPIGPGELESMFKDYERRCGRTPEARLSGKVPIDLDIVIVGKDVVRPRDWKLGFFQKGWLQIVPGH